ncbi:MAG: hypothetical protein V7647_419 [Acidobacteriota bacterium]|jgi:hypothetical protein
MRDFIMMCAVRRGRCLVVRLRGIAAAPVTTSFVAVLPAYTLLDYRQFFQSEVPVSDGACELSSVAPG